MVPFVNPQNLIVDWGKAVSSGIQSAVQIHDIVLRNKQAKQMMEMRELNMQRNQLLIDKMKKEHASDVFVDDYMGKNAARWNKALRTNDTDEMDAIEDELLGINEPKLSGLWGNIVGPWGEKLYTDSEGRVMKRSDWREQRRAKQGKGILATESERQQAAQEKEGFVGGIKPATPEDRILYEAALGEIKAREDHKLQGGTDKTYEKAKKVKAKEIHVDLDKKNATAEYTSDAWKTQNKIVNEIEKSEQAPEILGGIKTGRFGNFWDRHFNVAISEWAKEAIRMLDAGEIGRGLSPVESANLRSKLVTLQGMSRGGIFAFLISPLDSAKYFVDWKGAKDMVNKMYAFEDAFRSVTKTKDEKAYNRLVQKLNKYLNSTVMSELDMAIETKYLLDRRKQATDIATEPGSGKLLELTMRPSGPGVGGVTTFPEGVPNLPENMEEAVERGVSSNPAELAEPAPADALPAFTETYRSPQDRARRQLLSGPLGAGR